MLTHQVGGIHLLLTHQVGGFIFFNVGGVISVDIYRYRAMTCISILVQRFSP